MSNAIKMLILGLTGRCNFACAYCYASEQPKDMMTIETACRAIDMAAVDGNSFILQLSGGEPLLAFDLIQTIVAYVREKKIAAVLQLQTNGSLITTEIAAFLKKEKIGVGVSLDGRPRENDACRRLTNGDGTSSLIADGIRTLAEAGVEIGFTCVVTNQNVRQLPGIVEMAYYFGNVRKIGFDLLRAQGRGMNLIPATTDELEEALRQTLLTASRLEQATGRKILFSHTERVDMLSKKQCAGFAHCHAMNGQAAFVDAQGNIYACASLSGVPAFAIGSVIKGVDPARQREIGRRIIQEMQFCKVCSAFDLCGGACFARWYGAKAHAGPYPPECVLKKTFIEAYEKN